jgi:ribosomal protein L7Ae-like RNA K-turn-binding protein
MRNDRILSLLGLALRGGNLVVGEEPVEGAARAKDARVLLLAADAADNTRRRVEHFADAGACLWLRVPYTKEQLGRAVGRTSAAIVAVTDIGLASAVVHRLAELDPARYDEAAAKLEVKSKRAAERRSEQLAHEKNVRQGKRKPKPPEPPREPPAAKPRDDGPPPRRPWRSGEGPSQRPPRAAAGQGSRRENDTPRKSRPSKENRPKPRAKPDPYAHSRPVKKGKGSFRKKEG